MTRTKDGLLGLIVMMLGMLLFVSVMAAAMLGPVSTEMSRVNVVAPAPRSVVVPTWLAGNQAVVQPGLAISDHATKHGTETGNIYELLLEGKCAGSRTFCGGSEIEELHVCIDPITGAIGAVIQRGAEISGFFEHRPGYWERSIARDRWEVCR